MFKDSVGSVMTLALVNLTAVFFVLTCLWLVVLATRRIVNIRGRKDAKAGDGKPAKLPARQATEMKPTAVVDEAELVAVKAAAIAAWEESPPGARGNAPPAEKSGWRRPVLQSGVRPRWR